MHKPDTQIQVPPMTREMVEKLAAVCEQEARMPARSSGLVPAILGEAAPLLRTALDQEGTEVQREGRRWTIRRKEKLTRFADALDGPELLYGEEVEVMPVSEHQAALEEAHDRVKQADTHVKASDDQAAEAIIRAESAEARALSAEEGLRGLAEQLQAWARARRAAAVDYIGPEKNQAIWIAKGYDSAADLLIAALSNPEGGEGVPGRDWPDCHGGGVVEVPDTESGEADCPGCPRCTEDSPPVSGGGGVGEADGAARIAAERLRQRSELAGGEGWDEDHDDDHDQGELVAAAIVYANPPLGCGWAPDDEAPDDWPWEPESFKPKDQVSNLVRAGALIAAEIDRLLRAEGKQSATPLPEPSGEAGK